MVTSKYTADAPFHGLHRGRNLPPVNSANPSIIGPLDDRIVAACRAPAMRNDARNALRGFCLIGVHAHLLTAGFAAAPADAAGARPCAMERMSENRPPSTGFSRSAIVASMRTGEPLRVVFLTL